MSAVEEMGSAVNEARTAAPDADARDAGSSGRAAPKRGKRSRANTRAALLAAAEGLLLETGFEGVTIDAICSRAGFTRGAFYSNFRTVSDVFFGLYEQKSREGLELTKSAVRAARESATAGADAETTVRRLLAVLPSDVTWFTLRARFLASAQADPQLATTFRTQGEVFVAGVAPLLASLAESSGLGLRPSPDAASRILIAAYLGAVMQGPLVNDPRHLLQDTMLAAWRGVVTGGTDE